MKDKIGVRVVVVGVCVYRGGRGEGANQQDLTCGITKRGRAIFGIFDEYKLRI